MIKRSEGVVSAIRTVISSVEAPGFRVCAEN
jgi:hypothetical protein